MADQNQTPRNTNQAQGNANQSNTSTSVQTRPTQEVRRWDPLDLFDDMERQFSQIWNSMWPWPTRSFNRPTGRSTSQMQNAAWAPTMDIYEQDGNLVVKADLPGVKKEDIDIEVDQDALIIKGQRQSENQVRDENYYRVERSTGTFYRRLPLPNNVSPDQIKANFNDGVLEVRLPKPEQEQSQRKKIPISTT
jgi:HSP20 family protein